MQFNIKKAPANASDSRRAYFKKDLYEGDSLFVNEAREITSLAKEGGTLCVAVSCSLLRLAYRSLSFIHGPHSELPSIDEILRLLVSCRINRCRVRLILYCRFTRLHI